MKDFLVSLLPYVAAFALVGLYTVTVGLLHLLALYIKGPAFPEQYPRLSGWMRATGIDFSKALYTLADDIPKPTLLANAKTAVDLMNVTPPKSVPKPPTITTLLLPLFALAAGAAVLLSLSCQNFPLASPADATATLEAGCKLVGILDPQGAPVAAVCEALAPALGPVIADAINALEKAGVKGELAKDFVPLHRGENVVGWARADIAPTVQAKLDVP